MLGGLVEHDNVDSLVHSEPGAVPKELASQVHFPFDFLSQHDLDLGDPMLD